MNKLDKDGQNAFDGAFAVVDRERLIEEETRVVTPWYKHFINSIVSPTKMMKENYLQEPPKGNSIAVVGLILSIVVIMMVSNMNAGIRQATYDILRNKGIAEDMLAQQYMVGLFIDGVSMLIGVLFSALTLSIGFQIIKSIFKDKYKFGQLYTVVLMGLYIGAFIQAIDLMVSSYIGVDYLVFSLASFADRVSLVENTRLLNILQFFSLETIVSMGYMTIGYGIISGKSNKQAFLRVAIIQLILFILTVFAA